jgi:tetratricopeptide (TPR) repeat protein
LAEALLEEYLDKQGAQGMVLTNLAKAYSAQGKQDLALATLWRALETDPNQENALLWYEAIFREGEGEEAGLRAFQRVAALPGSWRAQLWLARHSLENGDLDAALCHYQSSLAAGGDPAPADLLTQMSGDLGNKGHLPEILDLVAPRFNIHQHGLRVGNNLIKANFDLGRLDAAQELVDGFQTLDRADYRETLNFWDTEIHKARNAAADPLANGKLSVSMLALQGPVWLQRDGAMAALFPGCGAEAQGICFLGSTATLPDPGTEVQRQLSNAPGRLSRGIPLLLSEYFHMKSDANPTALVPWLSQAGGGFVLSGVRWQGGDACTYARAGESPSDYLVLTHLDVTGDPWKVEAQVFRTIDCRELAATVHKFPAQMASVCMPALITWITRVLQDEAGLGAGSGEDFYSFPGERELDDYLFRIEQCLAVRCSTMEGAEKVLSNPSEIIMGMIQLCLRNPRSVNARALLVAAWTYLARTKPDLADTFKDKLRLLMQEHPLAAQAQAALNELLS